MVVILRNLNNLVMGDSPWIFVISTVMLVFIVYYLSITLRVDTHKYLEFSELFICIFTLTGVIVLIITFILFLLVSEELTDMLGSIRRLIAIGVSLFIIVSLVLTIALIRKEGRIFVMKNLFLIDGPLEKPLRRFFGFILIITAFSLQGFIKKYYGLGDYYSMGIVLLLINTVLGVLYLTIQKNFSWFFGQRDLPLLVSQGENGAAISEVENVLKGEFRVKFKGLRIQQLFLKGGSLLKTKNKFYGCRSVCTIEDGLAQLGISIDSDRYSPHYLGNSIGVLEGLESKMLPNQPNPCPLQSVNVMDEVTAANVRFRIIDYENRVAIFDSEKRVKGTPQWSCPSYKSKIIRPYLERYIELEKQQAINMAELQKRTGWTPQKSLKHGLSGPKHAISDFNTLMRLNKKYQAGVLAFSVGTAVLTTIKANTGM